jgi:hypothetical protein
MIGIGLNGSRRRGNFLVLANLLGALSIRRRGERESRDNGCNKDPE